MLFRSYSVEAHRQYSVEAHRQYSVEAYRQYSVEAHRQYTEEAHRQYTEEAHPQYTEGPALVQGAPSRAEKKVGRNGLKRGGTEDERGLLCR